jgi:hypothetical protein
MCALAGTNLSGVGGKRQMSNATISLTDSFTGERRVIVWQNISYFSKERNVTEVRLVGKYTLQVKESVEQVERMIEQAAHK